MRVSNFGLAALGILACLGACGPSMTGGGDDQPGEPDAFNPRPPPGGGNEFADATPTQACDQMDILFVVDNSLSMREEQTNLSQNFPMFIDVLNSFRTEGGAEIDYRVAVTSTGITRHWTEETPFGPAPNSINGEDGEMLQRCGMGRRWVEKGDSDPAGTFACAAALGTNGSGLEMPLLATKMAFGDRVTDGTNSGFIRENALLGLVILTDEDDCSREQDNFHLNAFEDPCATRDPVAPYKAYMDQVSGGEGRWAVAVIAGTGPGVCTSSFGEAEEAARLKQFANMAGANGIVSSICEGDLASALGDALATFDLACDNLPPID